MSVRPNIKNLLSLTHYLRPYRRQVVGAALALFLSSASVLSMGAGLRYMVDNGLGKNNIDLLDKAFFILLAVVLLLAAASYARFFLVSWIGERMIADIRNDVYRHLISKSSRLYAKLMPGWG